MAAWIVLSVSLVLPWISAGDHPLYSPDEGRYAAVAMSMSEGASLIAPELNGRAHLTKPPLVFWEQAIGLKLLGHNELAVRMPSLLATMGIIGLTFLAGCHAAGVRRGVLAVAILSPMPLHLIVGRLGTTDATLSLCWATALLAGWRASETGHTRWAAITWSAIALGLLTKGPVALLPAAILVIWLALSARWRDVRRLRVAIGLSLALLPLAIWVAAVIRAHPEAMDVWRAQILGRFIGEAGANAHAEPWWYYFPVLAGGMFPASLMLPLPGVHLSWRESWLRLRSGSPTSLWVLAMLVPVVVLSAFAGKLATYVLPLAMPMAMVAASTLDVWLNGPDRLSPAGDRQRVPDFVGALLVVLTGVASAAIIAVMLWEPAHTSSSLITLLLPLSGLALMLARSSVARRQAAALAVFASISLAWVVGFEFEDSVMRPLSGDVLLRSIRQATSGPGQSLYIYGFRDSTLQFYGAQPCVNLDNAAEILDAIEKHPHDFVLIADRDNWGRLCSHNPRITQKLELRSVLDRLFRKQLLVLAPRADAVQDAAR